MKCILNCKQKKAEVRGGGDDWQDFGEAGMLGAP